ncbi:hypothetical protein LCGC14_2783550, partial [marine sediment metagenome]
PSTLLPMIETYVRQFEASANLLVDTHIDMDNEKERDNVWAIAAKMVDSAGKAGNKKDGTANGAMERVNRIMSLFGGEQPGADTPECRDTGWGLYQAGNHFLTHEKGTRGEDERTQRFKSLLPGKGGGSASKEIVKAWTAVTGDGEDWKGLGIHDKMKELVAVN